MAETRPKKPFESSGVCQDVNWSKERYKILETETVGDYVAICLINAKDAAWPQHDKKPTEYCYAFRRDAFEKGGFAVGDIVRLRMKRDKMFKGLCIRALSTQRVKNEALSTDNESLFVEIGSMTGGPQTGVVDIKSLKQRKLKQG